MLDTDDTKIDSPKIITGAIYERERPIGGTEQMVCLARVVNERGTTTGLFRRLGITFERFEEIGEELSSWKMLWYPGKDAEDMKMANAPKTPAKSTKNPKKIAEAK